MVSEAVEDGVPDAGRTCDHQPDAVASQAP